MEEKIKVVNGEIKTPDFPIIPFIEGDGIGKDIMSVSMKVWEKSIEKAYNGKRKIIFKEIYAGEKAYEKYGTYLPDETLKLIKEYTVSIKGPLTTPVSGGFRSLNVTMRQTLDLFACVRPVRYFKGIESPMKHPEKLDVVIFRENTEDVYAGIEWKMGSEDVKKFIKIMNEEFGIKIREDSGVGVKPISEFATKRLVRMAIKYAIRHKRKNITFVHKGNIMKFTEGAFKNWAYELALEEFRDYVITEDELFDQVKGPDGVTPITKEGAFAHLRGGNPPGVQGDRIVIKDRIADQMFQQILTRPEEYDIVVTPNLNGDYLSDACAAQVGGLGIAPGANIGDEVALFEPTHGSAPKYKNLNKANPSSLILSGTMMLRYIGWIEPADMIEKALENTFLDKKFTYDLARLVDVEPLGTKEFGEEIIKRL